MHNIPSGFQKRTIWTAVTALSIALLGALLVGVVYLGTRMLAFLQPLLVPFAVAGVLAYLLEPLVLRLMKWGLSRHKAVWLVFSAATVIFVGALLVVVPVAIKQGAQFAHVLPHYTKVAGQKVSDWAASLNDHLRREYGLDLFRTTPAKPPPADSAPASAPVAIPDTKVSEPGIEDPLKFINGDWLEKELPALMNQGWQFIRSGLGGFLGIFGFLISFVIVPLYLYYFLTEAPKISDTLAGLRAPARLAVQGRGRGHADGDQPLPHRLLPRPARGEPDQRDRDRRRTAAFSD